MRKAKQSTAKNIMVYMVSSTDHIAGVAGATLTVTLSKNGAAFASISPTITDRGNGWYSVALVAGDTDTLGDLAVRATAAGCDSADLVILVEGGSTDADVSSRMAIYTQPAGFLAATFPAGTIASTTNITAGTITTASNLTNLPTMPTDWLTAAGLSAGAITEMQAGLATPTNITAATGITLAAVTHTGAVIPTVTTVNGLASGVITAASIAADAITAAKVATDVSAEIADQVWDEILSGHGIIGSTGAALSAAGGSGDPWSTALPGGYGAGTAGKIIGDNINAAISSRMASYTQPTGFLAATFPAGTVASTTNITGGTVTTTTNLTNLPSIPANWLTSAGIAAAALNGKGDWNIGKTGYTLTQAFPANFASASITAGGLVDITQSAADKAWLTAVPGIFAAGTAGNILGSRLDASISSLKQATIQKGSTERIPFEMLDSATGNLFPGAVITAQRSLDGGALTTATGAVTAIGSGLYYITPAVADTNANEWGVLMFAAAGCKNTIIYFKTSD
jgi:hypothetical protein